MDVCVKSFVVTIIANTVSRAIVIFVFIPNQMSDVDAYFSLIVSVNNFVKSDIFYFFA